MRRILYYVFFPTLLIVVYFKYYANERKKYLMDIDEGVKSKLSLEINNNEGDNNVTLNSPTKNNIITSNHESLGEREGKVTIIIAFCTRHEAVKNAIDSVRNQTYTNWKLLLIIDDATSPVPCGTTVTEFTKYIRETKRKNEPDSQIKILSANESCGTECEHGTRAPGFARNVGLMHADTKYVAFLDDDDCFFPEKIQIQLERMVANKAVLSCSNGYDIKNNRFNEEGVFTPLECTPENVKRLGYKLRMKPHPKHVDIVEPPFNKTLNPVITSSAMIDLNFLKKNNLKFDPMNEPWRKQITHKRAEDFILWMQIYHLAGKGRIIFINKALIAYDLFHGRLTIH